LQITIAAGDGQPRPAGHQGAVKPPAAPGRDGAAAPQAGEIGAGRELDPRGADRLRAIERDHHRDRVRRAGHPVQQALPQLPRLGAEGPLVDGEHLLDAGLAGHLADAPAGRERLPGQVRRHPGRLGDHEHFGVIGQEPGRHQAESQVRRLIVVVELPFELLAAGPEERDLGGDHRVGVALVQPRPGDPRRALVVGRDVPDDRAVRLHDHARLVRLRVLAHLGIEQRERAGVRHREKITMPRAWTQVLCGPLRW
jgi:hypothetical protein